MSPPLAEALWTLIKVFITVFAACALLVWMYGPDGDA